MEIEGCPLPDDRLYDLENEVWFKRTGQNGSAEVGLMPSIASFAGKFLAVTYRTLDGVVARGRSVATVESVRYTGAVRLPVDARIEARNPEVVERPKLVNDHPFDRGWIVRIVPTDAAAPTHSLESAEEIAPRLRTLLLERRVRCYPAVPDVEMYEIGSECQAILVRLDDELARLGAEEVVLVVTDDPTSPIEMVRWTDRTGHTVLHHRVDGVLNHFLVRREARPVPRPPPVELPKVPAGP